MALHADRQKSQIIDRKLNVKFDCIVPEKLRLQDECDWSDAPYSLLPFEYGPSSEETAGRYGGAVMKHCGDM